MYNMQKRLVSRVTVRDKLWLGQGPCKVKVKVKVNMDLYSALL